MNKSYDVYMCRPDNRPTLTIDKLRQFQTTVSNGWYQSVDVHTAVRMAKEAGYKVPLDIFQSYLADEQKRRTAILFDGQLGTGKQIIRKTSWFQRIFGW